GIARRDSNADAAHQFRQTVLYFLPGAAAVDRLVNAALLAAAAMRPRFALETPHACVEDVWISRIDLEIGGAVLVIDVKRLVPGPPTVRSHEHAAFFVWSKRVTESSDVND